MKFQSFYERAEKGSLIYPELSDEVRTVPGLSSEPSVLLNRVQAGLITPDDFKVALSNHDDDPDTYPLEEESDLALSYERMVANRESLQERIAEIKAKKAEEANQKAAETKKILDEVRAKKQAEELQKYFNKSENYTSISSQPLTKNND